MTERIRRPRFGALEIEVTIDDSKAYAEALDGCRRSTSRSTRSCSNTPVWETKRMCRAWSANNLRLRRVAVGTTSQRGCRRSSSGGIGTCARRRSGLTRSGSRTRAESSQVRFRPPRSVLRTAQRHGYRRRFGHCPSSELQAIQRAGSLDGTDQSRWHVFHGNLPEEERTLLCGGLAGHREVALYPRKTPSRPSTSPGGWRL